MMLSQPTQNRQNVQWTFLLMGFQNNFSPPKDINLKDFEGGEISVPGQNIRASNHKAFH